MVRSREDDPAAQGEGYDCEVTYRDGNVALVEVKACSYRNGKAFFEVMCADKDGCFLTSKADVWCYFQYGVNKLYWLPLEETRRFVMGPDCRFVLREAWTRRSNGNAYPALGRVVRLADVLAVVPGAMVLPVWGDVIGFVERVQM